MPLPIEFSHADFAAVLPATVLFLTGVAALLADLFVRSTTGSPEDDADGSPSAEKTHLTFIGVGGGVLALATLGFRDQLGGTAEGSRLMAGALTQDLFGMCAGALIIVAGIFTALSCGSYLAAHRQNRGEFHGLLWLGAGAMVLLTQATNLISIFVAIETLSLSVYVLAGFFRQWRSGSEAAMKYFVMGAFSSGFLLLGMAFLYGATRSVELSALASPDADPYLLVGGIVLVLVGMAFKVGAVPFHSWVPDVYQGAPAIAVGWMATAVKVASFALLVRLVVAASGSEVLLRYPGEAATSTRGQALGLVVALLAVATMILGNLAAIRQTNIKRMLAYSAIAHSGYLLIPVYLAFRPEAQVNAGAAVLFYLLAYVLMTFGAFTVISIVSRGEHDREEIDAFNGLGRSHPALALALTVSLLSLAGIPLTGGFFGKLLIFQGAVSQALSGGWDQGLFNIALVGILMSIVSAFYYIRPIKAMYFCEPEAGIAKVDTPWGMHLTLAFTTVGTLVVGIFPGQFIEFSQQAIKQLTS